MSGIGYALIRMRGGDNAFIKRSRILSRGFCIRDYILPWREYKMNFIANFSIEM